MGYECDICGDKFTRPYLMKQHQEYTHKKNLPFKCTECGKSLRSKTFLKIHMTKVHHITTKVTRQSLKQLVLEGKHPFCSQPDDIPGFYARYPFRTKICYV